MTLIDVCGGQESLMSTEQKIKLLSSYATVRLVWLGDTSVVQKAHHRRDFQTREEVSLVC